MFRWTFCGHQLLVLFGQQGRGNPKMAAKFAELKIEGLTEAE